MPSYRFCRPDDLPLIIRAINACYLMHYPDTPTMTDERLKEHMTLFQVRPGNCMVALERQQPVGFPLVLVGQDVGDDESADGLALQIAADVARTRDILRGVAGVPARPSS